MCKRLTGWTAAVAALLLTGSASLAAEGARIAAAAERATAPASAQSTKPSRAATALEVAAELGVLDAQLKLARLYASGNGVPHSHAKAFDIYQRIADDHADVRPYHVQAADVARAFVALGNYYRTGIPGSDVKSDKRRAASLLWHAASYLGDAEAQCNLAQMYLDGEGVSRSTRLAVNWLTNAAKKRHAKSQALLGDLLWRGAKDLRRQPLKGLAFLSLARQNARDAAEAAWIDDLYHGAYSGSQAHERESAAQLAARWQARMGRPHIAVDTPEPAEVKPEPAVTPGDSAQIQAGPNVKAGFTNVGMEGPAALR